MEKGTVSVHPVSIESTSSLFSGGGNPILPPKFWSPGSDANLLPWKLEPDNSLRAGGSAEGCLDALLCGTADGTRVSVFGCHPNNTCPSKLIGCMCGYKNQQWNVTRGTIRNVNSGTCVTWRTVNGQRTLPHLSKCNASVAQRFSLSEEDGTIRAGGAASSTCLVAGASVPALPPPGGPTSMDITAQVFARSMGFTAAQDIAVVMLNRAEAPANLSVTWAELGIPSGQHMHVRDIVDRKDLPMTVGDMRHGRRAGDPVTRMMSHL